MKKKLLSISMVAVLAVSILTGCGYNVTEVSADPTIEAVEDESAEATVTVEPETTDEPKEIEASVKTTEPVETSASVVESAKPVETEKPAATPKPTEKPVETPAPATPTPAPVHTHNHVLTSSTSGANCTNAGVDTYTCECGDSYTTNNSNYGAHNWTTTTSTETVHHDAETWWVDGITCGCGIFWPFVVDGSTATGYRMSAEFLEHENGWYDEDGNHYYYCGGWGTSIQEVEISPAYDEVVTHTHTSCTNCGAEQ